MMMEIVNKRQKHTMKRTVQMIGKKKPGASIPSVAKNGCDFPVVGVGASAGGLTAFEAFFSSLSASQDSGMAFILVQHLAPDHKSLLPELVQRYTRMRVFEAIDGITVKPNCVYIIPPNCDVAFLGGTLQLMEPSAPHGQRLPIDFFFRSLAQDQRDRAIGIVLSGTGSDGSQGARAIKAEGGMVMAQNPESTEFDGMPRSVMAMGLADYVLSPAEMLPQLIAYTTHALARISDPVSPSTPMAEGVLKKIYLLFHPADRAAHGGSPDQEVGRLCSLPAKEFGGVRGAFSRPFDWRDPLLS